MLEANVMRPLMKNNMLSLNKTEKLFLVTTLVFCEAILFAADQKLGAGISVRPLFVIPIILSAIFINAISTVFFIALSTLLHVESYRTSDFGPDKVFSYAPNIIALAINYTIISTIVTMGIRYRDRSISLRHTIIENKLSSLSEDNDQPPT